MKPTRYKMRGGKVPMELITNEKARRLTLFKRKLGLKKKLQEFTTLCGVDACMILYEPCDDNSMKLDLWPENHSVVGRIIDKYKSKSKATEGRSHRNVNLSDYFEKREIEMEDDIVKQKHATCKVRSSIWDYHLNRALVDQLNELLGLVNRKIEHVSLVSEIAKEKQQLASNGGSPDLMPMLPLPPIYFNPSCGSLQNMIYDYQPVNSSCGSLQNMICDYQPVNSSLEYYSQQSIFQQLEQQNEESLINRNASNAMIPTAIPHLNEVYENVCYFSEEEILKMLGV